MNFSLLTWNPLASRHDVVRDDEANDWLGGDGWVTPQPFNIECNGTIAATRDVDPANDWIPL